MDSLKVRGRFVTSTDPETGEQVSRPFLLLAHSDDLNTELLDFLVDTGADLTLINPSDAVSIWGSNYFEFDFDSEDPQIAKAIGGVGGEIRCVWQDLSLGFELFGTGEDWTYSTFRVLVAPAEMALGMSLLGWDIMSIFQRIEFRRSEGIVELVLPPPEI